MAGDDQSADAAGTRGIVPGAVDPARVRHDVFTPLNHIIGYSEMLLEDEHLPPPFRRDLERIRRSGRRLATLVDKEFEDREEEAERDVRQLFYDLRTPANGIIGYSELLIEEATLENRLQLAADLGKIVAAAQAFVALVETHFCQGRDLLSSTARSASPDRPPGRGPANPATPEGDDRPRVTHAPTPIHPVTGRVLIIDDDRPTREILARRLTATGNAVETASDGRSGLGRLRRGGIDLVLVDMVMPGVSGAEVLAEIKGDPALADIPVIVVSALADEDGIARCIELGAEDYLSKPFNPAVLRARVSTSLEKHRLRLAEKEHLDRIEQERRRSDDLLLNVLPEPIAARLKAGEERIADHFDEVSVLFADIAGFTPLSASGDPADLVEMLNAIFSMFDTLSDQHGLEKIKTIGDAYMVVSGLPSPKRDHAEAIAHFALDLTRAMHGFNREHGTGLEIRVGVATGPVVAGIIGRRKFIYDLWGDTVNTASRMESHGTPGEIHVDPRTRERLKDHFDFAPCGETDIKGKGRMETYFLRGVLASP